MESTTQFIELAETGIFPKLFIEYIQQTPQLKPFYNQFPTVEAFGKLIEGKKLDVSKRKILVDALQRQYQHIANAPDFSVLLDEKTYTVTTGHQLNIFTGPLYIIYKIVTIIRLAEELKKAYPDYNFVPVYWMATEDHDFEEIASFNLFGKKYTWESEQKGAVGRMNPKELEAVLSQLPDTIPLFSTAYLNNNTLADAVRQYMHELFGKYGLVSLDGDDRELKHLFASVMEDDIFNESASSIVHKTSEQLATMGYKTQITAREINFFYLENGLRERILKVDDEFQVHNTDIRFSADEMREIIVQQPEKLSPNVVLRPVYQETILPNLAYIGGPSEVPYWLQLKAIFDYYKTQFPALIPRNFALIVNKANQKKLDKLGITVEELFEDEAVLRRSFVERNSEHSLSLAFEIDDINDVFKRIIYKGVAIDATLQAVIEAEAAKTMKSLDHLEKRLKKAEERNFETSVTQLLHLKEKLFPGGSLQERKENFLNFYLNDNTFIERLMQTFNPLDFRFYVLMG